MGIKLLFNYKNLNQKLKQIKLLQTLFKLSLEEAKYAVSSQKTEKTFQLTVYSHLQNLSPQECILLNKKEYEKERKELMKYKSLYFDLVGSINSILNEFLKNN